MADNRRCIAARVRVADYMTSGGTLSISDLAEREGIHVGDASRSLRLAFLTLDLLERILDGDQPVGLSAAAFAEKTLKSSIP